MKCTRSNRFCAKLDGNITTPVHQEGGDSIMNYPATGKFQAMLFLKDAAREAALVTPPAAKSVADKARMPRPRCRTPVVRFSPDTKPEGQIRTAQKRKSNALLQSDQKSQSPVKQKTVPKARSPKQPVVLSKPALQDTASLDVLTKLVLQNVRILKEMEASIDSNSKRRDNIEAANPFRRLAFLARHGRQPKFSDYLHAMSEYKSMHGHLRVKRHEDSRLYEYILELRSDLMQRASLPLSVNRIQRIQILKQLGLAAEIVSFHGKRKQPMRQRSNLESLPEQRWSDEFMHFVVEPTLEDYVPTFESQASRLQWLHQQQVEYFAVKAKSDDPYTNILANFRYILLNSAEEEAKAEGCKSSAD